LMAWGAPHHKIEMWGTHFLRSTGFSEEYRFPGASVEQDGYVVGGELLAGLFTGTGSDGG
jgi:hypothetical protein